MENKMKLNEIYGEIEQEICKGTFNQVKISASDIIAYGAGDEEANEISDVKQK